ncbi:hypothetical protein K525DRAFT_212893 [Schizophyllum commune Loenen D]|nr:hypothetical protein K525DRAFT_212893 [Schizophyllum commune Loenen D]
MEKINPTVYRLRLPSTYPMHTYEVQAILGHRFTKKKDGNRLQYLVRWKNYGPEDDQWITEDALRNSPLLRKEYWKMKESQKSVQPAN